MAEKQHLAKCPICGAFVREDRLKFHIEKQHQRESGMRNSELSRPPYKQPELSSVVKTKLARETQPGKFIALGYGDVSASQLQLVVISSFLERYFAPDSAIGSIATKLGKDYLLQHWPANGEPGDAILLDLSARSSGVRFKYLVVLFTGHYEPRLPADLSIGRDIWLQMQIGLSNLNSIINNLNMVNSIDITALGTQYGGIERQKVFEIISRWALGLFELAPSVNLVRMTSNDIDTFVDFFEALYKLPNWQSSNSLGKDISHLLSVNSGQFANDIQTVVQTLGSNPAAAISWCRTIIERVVKEIYAQKAKQYPGNLSVAVDGLKSIVTLPPQFHAYLDVVRRLGNFATHSDDLFTPSLKDAEIILSLALRVIDYWETNKKSV